MPKVKHHFAFWVNKGLRPRAARALVAAGCTSEADVRVFGPINLIRIPDCRFATIREIGRVLFNDENWLNRKHVNLTDETLIAELQARGYSVSKKEQSDA